MNTLTPIFCQFCLERDCTRQRYGYLPHSLGHLRDHMIRYHPSLVPKFEEGWSSLPRKKQLDWIRGGSREPEPRGYHNLHRQFLPPMWNSWREAMRKILQDKIVRLDQDVA